MHDTEQLYTILQLNNSTDSKYTQLEHIYACMHARKLGDGKLKSSHKCCGSDADPPVHDHACELRPCMHFSTLAWMLTSHLELASNTKAGSDGPHATYYWQLQSGTEKFQQSIPNMYLCTPATWCLFCTDYRLMLSPQKLNPGRSPDFTYLLSISCVLIPLLG